MCEQHKDLDVRNLATKNKSSNSNFYNYKLYLHKSVSLTLISHRQYLFLVGNNATNMWDYFAIQN